MQGIQLSCVFLAHETRPIIFLVYNIAHFYIGNDACSGQVKIAAICTDLYVDLQQFSDVYRHETVVHIAGPTIVLHVTECSNNNAYNMQLCTP